jgi:hypothetical protein
MYRVNNPCIPRQGKVEMTSLVNPKSAVDDRHMVIKTLSRKLSGQNLSYAHYLSGLHNTIQDLYDISPPKKVLPPCFCCPYACLLACLHLTSAGSIL